MSFRCCVKGCQKDGGPGDHGWWFSSPMPPDPDWSGRCLCPEHERERAIPKVIAIRLPCPDCGALHIDAGEWATKPHHTHACQACGMTWRPAVENTVGVRFLPGYKDGPPAETKGGG